jgi:hypothetical protein
MRSWGLAGSNPYRGGGFNLVRNKKEKSNGQIDFGLAEAFNDWINVWGLIELNDPP